MKIISPFRDYYDHVLAHGRDDQLVYYRIPKEVSSTYIPDFSNKLNTFDTIPGIIGFCGKIYPFIGVKKPFRPDFSRIGKSSPPSSVWNFYYNLDSLHRGLQRYYPDWQASINETILACGDVNGHQRKHGLNYTVKSFFDDYTDNQSILSVFQEHNAPVFLYTTSSYETGAQGVYRLNPNLHDYGFQTVVDPFQAFQEISMYIGGVLQQPTTPMVQISDDIRIHKHGMDKWSFRKPPQKRK